MLTDSIKTTIQESLKALYHETFYMDRATGDVARHEIQQAEQWLAAIAQLAEASEWQPLSDGIEYIESRGLCYSIFDNGEGFAVGLEQGGGHFKWPDNIRLCQRTPAR